MGVIQACFVGHRKDGIKTGHFPPIRTQVTMPMKEDLFITVTPNFRSRKFRAWTCTVDPAYWNKKHHIKGPTFGKVTISVTGDLTTPEAIYSAYFRCCRCAFCNIDCLGKIVTKVCKKCKQHHPRNVYENLTFGPFPFFHFMYASFRSVTAKRGATMTPALARIFFLTSLDQEFIVLNLKNIKNADNYTGSTS